MPRPPKEEDYLQPAIELMVRDGIGLREAIALLNAPVTSEECKAIERRANFKAMLWATRHRYWAELGSNPERTKASTIGQLQLLAMKLMDEGEYEKAAEVLYKICRAEGWTGSESTVNVFAGLSAKEFSELRERLKAAAQAQLN